MKFHEDGSATVRVVELHLTSGDDNKEGRYWEHPPVFGHQFVEAGEELPTTVLFNLTNPPSSVIGWTVFSQPRPRRGSGGSAAGPGQTKVSFPVPPTSCKVPSLRSSRRAARAGGVVVSYGFSFTVGAGHSKYGGLTRTVAALARAKLTPGPKVLVRAEDPAKKDPAAYRQDLTRLVGMLADGRIRPVVTTMRLSEAAEAHRRLEGRQVVGKLVLVPDGVA